LEELADIKSLNVKAQKEPLLSRGPTLIIYLLEEEGGFGVDMLPPPVGLRHPPPLDTALRRSWQCVVSSEISPASVGRIRSAVRASLRAWWRGE